MPRCSDFLIYILGLIFIIATSTDVERAFSGGQLTVSRMRHSLGSKSTRAATVLGSWVKVPGLLQETQLLSIFRGACQVIDISDD
jgi:hypothetical protein